MNYPKHRVIRSGYMKQEARKLRLKGRSLSEMVKILNVPKSTLHGWIRDLGRPERFTGERRKIWWKEMQKLAVNANKKKYAQIYEKILNKARKEANSVVLNAEFRKSILAMLYWAEGAKGDHRIVCFANTDPRLVALFISLLRNAYSIDESKFRVRLHLHDYHDEDRAKNFWSVILHIPLSQFGKSYRKERSKEKAYRRNFGGICFLKYNSVYLQKEIMTYSQCLGERVTGKVSIPTAPVA